MTAGKLGIVSALALASLASWTPSAHAYLDPGTGSLILQSIIGLIAGALVAIRVYWGRIKMFFGSKSTKDRNRDSK
jgi:hypothetical protein